MAPYSPYAAHWAVVNAKHGLRATPHQTVTPLESSAQDIEANALSEQCEENSPTKDTTDINGDHPKDKLNTPPKAHTQRKRRKHQDGFDLGPSTQENIDEMIQVAQRLLAKAVDALDTKQELANRAEGDAKAEMEGGVDEGLNEIQDVAEYVLRLVARSRRLRGVKN